MASTYHCPHCQKQITWDKHFPHRPFCSERCKLIDFGDWANENHRIPSDVVENPEDFPESDSNN